MKNISNVSDLENKNNDLNSLTILIHHVDFVENLKVPI